MKGIVFISRCTYLSQRQTTTTRNPVIIIKHHQANSMYFHFILCILYTLYYAVTWLSTMGMVWSSVCLSWTLTTQLGSRLRSRRIRVTLPVDGGNTETIGKNIRKYLFIRIENKTRSQNISAVQPRQHDVLLMNSAYRQQLQIQSHQ